MIEYSKIYLAKCNHLDNKKFLDNYKRSSEILQSGKTLFGTSLLSVTVVRCQLIFQLPVYLSIFGTSCKMIL